MTNDKPLVLVLGGTGLTGKSVVEGLLKSGNFVRAQLQVCPLAQLLTV